MSNCIEYMELISAYIDNELSDSDNMQLEAHLHVCLNCSSILEAYRGISLAVNESCVPAPESLCSGVMERIADESADRDSAAKVKIYKTVNIILTRYVPVAACLVFLFLTIPRIFGIGALNDRAGFGGSPSAPMPSSANSRWELAPDAGGGSTGDLAGREIWESNEEYIHDEADSYSSGAAPGAAMEEHYYAPAPNEPAAQAPAAPAPAPDFAAEADQNDTAGGVGRDDNLAQVANDSFPAMEQPESEPAPMGSSAGAENSNVAGAYDGYRRDVYAVIRITGDLPGFLKEREPDDASTDGELLFELTRDDAEMLIREISEHYGSEVIIDNENGLYALVYYAPQAP